MAPRRIDRVSVFTNITAKQAKDYLAGLLTNMSADGVVLFADDIKGLQSLINRLVEMEETHGKNRRRGD